MLLLRCHLSRRRRCCRSGLCGWCWRAATISARLPNVLILSNRPCVGCGLPRTACRRDRHALNICRALLGFGWRFGCAYASCARPSRYSAAHEWVNTGADLSADADGAADRCGGSFVKLAYAGLRSWVGTNKIPTAALRVAAALLLTGLKRVGGGF